MFSDFANVGTITWVLRDLGRDAQPVMQAVGRTVVNQRTPCGVVLWYRKRHFVRRSIFGRKLFSPGRPLRNLVEAASAP
ncbi:MAG: hypothetical protein AB7U61_07840 [Methylocystis sp.]